MTIRCVFLGSLLFAWLITAFTWYSMKLSSLQESSSISDLSFLISSAVIWYALCLVRGFCFEKQRLVKCPYFLQARHSYFFAGQVKPCTCLVSPHLEQWSGLPWAWDGLKSFFCGSLPSLDLKCCLCLCPFFFLCANLVCWCRRRLIWAACGWLVACLMCRAVALLDSNFLANWCTLLAVYCSRSAQPSFNVFDTKSSSFR